MKIHILRKSISSLKTPIERKEYLTHAVTVREFLSEMVERNYKARPIEDKLEDCVQVALDDFSDGCFYIVNATQNNKYADLDEKLNLCDGDEIMLVKLKYVRGII
ncbi:MAG: hypothetical protein K2I46_02890, partial [Clostridia bacterium]|nr:hypothetical protein [Clostridia bacterium]